MSNPLNYDPYARPSSEQEFGTKHPRRFEPSIKTIEATQPQQRMRARVHQAAATQSIANNAATTVVFDTVDFDTSGILTSNKFKITATGKITGTWLFHAHVTWAAATAGLREIDILADAAIIATGRDVGSATDEQ